MHQLNTLTLLAGILLAGLLLSLLPPSQGEAQRPDVMDPHRTQASAELMRMVDAAIIQAGNPVQRARRLQRRARRAGWLPRLRLGLRHGRARDALLRAGSSAPSATHSTDEDLAVDVTLTFRLGQLIYAAPAASLAQQELRAHRAEQAVSDRVVSLYYERLSVICAPPTDPINRNQRRLRIARVEAELALLTGQSALWTIPSEEGVEVQLPVWCTSADATTQDIRSHNDNEHAQEHP